MPTIKGPFKLTGGVDFKKILDKAIGKTKITLPFTATGWKSEKNSDLVKGGKVLAAEDKKVKKTVEKKVKTETKKYTKTEIAAENRNWQVNKIKELGGNVIPRLETGRVKMILKLQG